MRYKGKKEKRIVLNICDASDTLNQIGDMAFKNDEKVKYYFNKYKTIEKSFGAEMKTVFTSNLHLSFIETLVPSLVSIFEKNKMKDRVSACLGPDTVFDAKGYAFRLRNNPHQNKAFIKSRILEEYEKHYDKNKNDVAFCIYSGDHASDKVMAIEQKLGMYYKNVPGAFIDTIKYQYSFTFGNGEIRPFACREEDRELSGLPALLTGYKHIIDLVNKKSIHPQKGESENNK